MGPLARLVVGTRASALALRQTQGVISALRARWPALELTVEPLRTAADQHPEQSFDRLPGIGFFVKELELALVEQRVDAAVHSMKDLPTVDTAGLRIGAIPEREDPSDVLVSRDGRRLSELPQGARIGTSSPRRAAFLRAARPDVVIVPLRGNVETRLRKMDAGQVDAVCLAGAGLRRLGLEARITEPFPVEMMLPAPGQGALGIQVREGSAAADLVSVLDHPSTRVAVKAERAVLRRLQGGCRLPVGAHAIVEDGRLTLVAAVVAPDGTGAVTGRRSGAMADAVEMGEDLADELFRRGAGTMLPARGALR